MLTVLLNVSGDDLDFEWMSVELGPETIERIKTLSAEAHRLDVYKIVEFDYRPIPLVPADSYWSGEPCAPYVEADVTTDCDTMNVKRNGVFWSGYVKHSNQRWETDSIPLDEIANATGVLDLRHD